MGEVEVQSLGYYTVVYMCLVRFRASGGEVNFFFNFETEDISEGELFFTFGGGTGHVNRVEIPPGST